ncbi:hypothetical protein C8R44DRAFT_771370 [Mycena epipterygia]|nr:hypothetical protein C8R44DRAFT_771370 [Mycena epipterygia]
MAVYPFCVVLAVYPSSVILAASLSSLIHPIQFAFSFSNITHVFRNAVPFLPITEMNMNMFLTINPIFFTHINRNEWDIGAAGHH